MFSELETAYGNKLGFEHSCGVKPGLHEPQLQVEWSVTFLYSLVVERRY